MISPRLTYAPLPDTTPEAELSALASVYRFILDSSKKEAARTGDPDDAKGSKHDRATQNCTR